MLDKWAADLRMTNWDPWIRSFITFDAATGVPWSSSPTMIRVGALMALIRSVRLRPEIAWQHPM